MAELAETAGTVAAASQQMASTSEEAGRAVGEIAAAVTDVAHGAERQVRMVEATREAVQEAARAAAASAEGATATADAADHARNVALDGVGAAEHATQAMNQVADSSRQVGVAIEALSARSERIGGIVDTITGIAEQTNLLALNAAIEAARAGEQGRGFAVVAEEVRKLAEESQAAAGQISSLIREMQTETSSVVGVVAEGGRLTADGVATVEKHPRRLRADRQRRRRRQRPRLRHRRRVQQIAAETQRAENEVTEVAAVAEESSASAEQVSASTQQTSASTQQIAASAQTLATPPAAQLARGPLQGRGMSTKQGASQQLVVFALGSEQYALPIASVSEIIRSTQPRNVASDNAWIRGVIGLRGKIIPIFDLAARLELPGWEPAENGKIVIVDGATGPVGVIVDDVEEVLTVAAEQFEDVPTATGAIIDAIARIGDRLVMVLDIAEVLDEPKTEAELVTV